MEQSREDPSPARVVPFRNEDGAFTGLDFTFNQDYMCWVSQGDIAQRHLEKLGASDEGIILFRKVLLEQLKRIQNGEEPTFNIFRDPEDNEGLEFPTIPNEAAELVGANRGLGGGKYFPQEAGWSRDEGMINSTMATWKNVDLAALAGAAR